MEQQKIENEIVGLFERENPDIKVRPMQVAGGPRYAEKLQAMMVGDVAPDVLLVDFFQYDEWASRNVLVDVTGVVKELTAEETFMPLAKRAFDRDGHYYAVPVNIHGFAMYCNLDALRAAGIPFSPNSWTWEQMLAMAPKLASRKGDPRAPTEYAMLMPPIETIFAGFGVKVFDDARHPTRVQANTPEMAAALRFYRDLQNSGYVVPPDVVNDEGTYQLFRDGRAAFFFSGRWSTPQLAGRTKFAWDVVPIPAGPAGAITMHGGTAIAIWKGTKHLEEAKRFVKFFAGPQGIQVAMKGGRNVPIYERLAYGKEFLEQRPPESIVNFSNTMQDGSARIQLYAPGYGEVRRILVRRVQQMIFRGAEIDQVMQGMQEDLEGWMEHARRLKLPKNSEPAVAAPTP